MDAVSTNDELIIRRMIFEDLESVLYVEKRAYEFGWTRGTFRSCLTNGNESWVIVPVATHQNVPFTLGHSIIAKIVDHAELLNLAIDPKYQGQGLGRLLLEHVIHHMKLSAINRVFLEVRQSNKIAQKLYCSLGFRHAGRRKNYYPAKTGREDALIFELGLNDR